MPEAERGRAGSVKRGIWGQSVGCDHVIDTRIFLLEPLYCYQCIKSLCVFAAEIPATKKVGS